MNDSASINEMSEAVFEIGRKFYPRRRCRHPDLRAYHAACAWARTLDWRNNPYDRFLLRRELIHYIDSTTHIDSLMRAKRLAEPGEIAAIIDHFLDTLAPDRDRLGVFTTISLRIPWEVAYRHGRVRYSYLTKALRGLPPSH